MNAYKPMNIFKESSGNNNTKQLASYIVISLMLVKCYLLVRLVFIRQGPTWFGLEAGEYDWTLDSGSGSQMHYT